jgi:hypothetical protein
MGARTFLSVAWEAQTSGDDHWVECGGRCTSQEQGGLWATALILAS